MDRKDALAAITAIDITVDALDGLSDNDEFSPEQQTQIARTRNIIDTVMRGDNDE